MIKSDLYLKLACIHTWYGCVSPNNRRICFRLLMRNVQSGRICFFFFAYMGRVAHIGTSIECFTFEMNGNASCSICVYIVYLHIHNEVQKRRKSTVYICHFHYLISPLQKNILWEIYTNENAEWDYYSFRICRRWPIKSLLFFYSLAIPFYTTINRRCNQWNIEAIIKVKRKILIGFCSPQTKCSSFWLSAFFVVLHKKYGKWKLWHYCLFKPI